MATIAEQAEGILALRQDTIMRQENKPSKYDKEAKRVRVKIDALKAQIDDAKQLRDEIVEG